MTKASPTLAVLFWPCLLFFVQSVQSHEEFEITSTARLQHHRLEVVAIMTLQTAGSLLGESADPEFTLRPANFELYRDRLQTAALNFYEITSGGVPLAPLQASVALPEPGHLRFTVFYPQPPSWPLKFRPGKVAGMPASAINDLGVYDQEERLLGLTVLQLHDLAAPELSVDPALPLPLPPPPVPTLAAASPALATAPADLPPATIPSSSLPHSWLGIAFGLALGLGTLVFVVALKKENPPST